jgi:hypothetical protein
MLWEVMIFSAKDCYVAWCIWQASVSSGQYLQQSIWLTEMMVCYMANTSSKKPWKLKRHMCLFKNLAVIMCRTPLPVDNIEYES